MKKKEARNLKERTNDPARQTVPNPAFRPKKARKKERMKVAFRVFFGGGWRNLLCQITSRQKLWLWWIGGAASGAYVRDGS